MGVKFKDKQSGNVFEFTLEHDIADMRRHPEYEEVKEEAPKPAPAKPAAKPVSKEE
jgi:hypothetical protein